MMIFVSRNSFLMTYGVRGTFSTSLLPKWFRDLWCVRFSKQCLYTASSWWWWWAMSDVTVVSRNNSLHISNWCCDDYDNGLLIHSWTIYNTLLECFPHDEYNGGDRFLELGWRTLFYNILKNMYQVFFSFLSSHHLSSAPTHYMYLQVFHPLDAQRHGKRPRGSDLVRVELDFPDAGSLG